MLKDHNDIVDGCPCNFLYKNRFLKKNVMSLDFAEIENIENMSNGMTYRTHFSRPLIAQDKLFHRQNAVRNFLIPST